MVREHPRESSYIPFLICAEFLCRTKRQRIMHDKSFFADKKRDARGWVNAVRPAPGPIQRFALATFDCGQMVSSKVPQWEHCHEKTDPRAEHQIGLIIREVATVNERRNAIGGLTNVPQPRAGIMLHKAALASARYRPG
jgi:hypothetical protein